MSIRDSGGAACIEIYDIAERRLRADNEVLCEHIYSEFRICQEAVS